MTLSSRIQCDEKTAGFNTATCTDVDEDDDLTCREKEIDFLLERQKEREELENQVLTAQETGVFHINELIVPKLNDCRHKIELLEKEKEEESKVLVQMELACEKKNLDDLEMKKALIISINDFMSIDVDNTTQLGITRNNIENLRWLNFYITEVETPLTQTCFEAYIRLIWDEKTPDGEVGKFLNTLKERIQEKEQTKEEKPKDCKEKSHTKCASRFFKNKVRKVREKIANQRRDNQFMDRYLS